VEARPLTRFIRATGVTDERVRADMLALPGMLDHVRELSAGICSHNDSSLIVGLTVLGGRRIQHQPCLDDACALLPSEISNDCPGRIDELRSY
jgi:hypothetical protein